MKSLAGRLVLAANRHWPCSELAKAPYELAARSVAVSLGSITGVEGLCARQSFAQGDYLPGLSDIDLLLRIVPASVADELGILQRVAPAYGRARRLFPMLGELEIGTAEELDAWLTLGGRAEAEARHWRPLAGACDFSPPEPGPHFAADVFSDVMLIVATDLHGRLFRGRPTSVRCANLFLRLERYFALMGARRDDVLQQDKRTFLATAGDGTIPREIRRLLEQGLANRAYHPAQLALLFERLVRQIDTSADRLSEAKAQRRSASASSEDRAGPQPFTLEPARPNETLPEVRERLSAFVAAAEALEEVTRVILGNGPTGMTGTMGNHSFRCYVLLTQIVGPESYFEAFMKVRAVWQPFRSTWPREHLGTVSVPLVVTPRILRALLAHFCPFESFYLPRFSDWTDVGSPERETLARHARRYAAYAALWLRSLLLPLLDPNVSSVRKLEGARRLFDALVALTAQRLFLETGVVVSTPAETVAAYGSLFADERAELAFLQGAHHQLALSPRAGPVEPIALGAGALSYARHQQRRIRSSVVGGGRD